MSELVLEESKLLTPAEPFDFSNPPTDPVELAKMLLDAVEKHNGLGIAANQIGLPYRAFAMRGEPGIVCFNPKVVDASDKVVLMEEGCLSYPDLRVKIKRPGAIRVRFTNEHGETITTKMSGLTARCFMHELDHLDGIAFHTRASRFHLEKARQLKKKVGRKRASMKKMGIVVQ